MRTMLGSRVVVITSTDPVAMINADLKTYSGESVRVGNRRGYRGREMIAGRGVPRCA